MSSEKPSNSAKIAIVSLRWNSGTIATRAVRPGDEVVLGDGAGSLAQLPPEVLGKTALTVADAEGGPHALIPDDKVAKITTASGKSRIVAGPCRALLRTGEEASIMFGDFEVTIASHENEKTTKRRAAVSGAWVHTAVVAAIHAGLLFAGSRAALASSLEANEEPNVEQIRSYLVAAEERSSAKDPIHFGTNGKTDSEKVTGRNGNGKRGGGERHAGEAGKAGSTASRQSDKHWGAKGKRTGGTLVPESDPMADAADFGMVGLLKSAENAPVRPIDGSATWGTEDVFTAFGGMLGRSLGESEGAGGLALTGIGEGGGGRGDGIGLGTIGTIGHSAGLPGIGTDGAGSSLSGFGIGQAFSWSHIGRFRSHRARSPILRCYCDYTSVSGRLPPEIVQRTIRQNFGRFRACYQDGLKRNPNLSGRVTTNFVIGRDGAVSNVADGGSSLPDPGVRSCVQRAFYGISFPQPEGGIVNVIYPLVFSKTE